ncbi:MAG: lysine--tRNA ligase [Nanoarchaeota archaeon]|nr:lysine--tRNA ligase [Nanoarchaeota archaeon]
MAETKHWADEIAEKLIRQNPKKKKFVCAAGISPSGIVHIGNFRDVITSDLICRALIEKGKEAEIIFSWDEFDRLRKVPKGIPESFSKYIGMPLSEIPDPYKCHGSYAKHFEEQLEKALPSLGIKPRYIHQSEMYKANKYYTGIKTALKKRREIAEILSRFKTQGMAEERIENYYPLQIYCSKCRSSLNTKIINYDEKNEITYSCACGNKETVDISKKNIGKLDWKVDWAMRWKYEDVAFEPGGEDHATPGGSYDVAKEIAKDIFGINPPFFQGYGFVGVEGAYKMSSSKGMGISPGDLLEIYEPELLRWIFTRVKPERPITLFFDSQIIRQYDEFDRSLMSYDSLPIGEKRELDFSKINPKEKLSKERIPFRQVASLGQIAQGDIRSLKSILEKTGQKYDDEELRERLKKAKIWVERFAPEMKIEVRKTPNKDFFRKLNKEEKRQIKELAEKAKDNWGIDNLTSLVYEIPKEQGMDEDEKKKVQRIFFRNVYQMLIDSDTGPRLPIFLLALGKEKIEKLLNLR